MGWVGHVAHIKEKRGPHRFLVGKPEVRDYLEDPGVDRRIILRWIFRKWDMGMYWIDVAQDWDRRRALVNEVKNRRVP